MLCVFWLRYRNKARKVFFDCEAFPKSDVRGDKIGKWACFAPIWRNKTEEGKCHAAGPLEVEGKSDGTGGSCVALFLPQIPLLASSCIMRLCLDASPSCTGALTCRNAGGLFLWLWCTEHTLRLRIYPLVAVLLWLHFETVGALSKIQENPLQKHFWGVSAFPYTCFFHVRSRIFLIYFLSVAVIKPALFLTLSFTYWVLLNWR